MPYRTKHDVTVRCWENQFGKRAPEITLPAGTELIKVRNPGGGYAVLSCALLVKLTGNHHDPYYRYVWVPDDAVEELQ